MTPLTPPIVPPDGGEDTTPAPVLITGEVEVSNDSGNPLDVNIVGGSSSGTEYTEGDVDASITGTAVMWEDAGDTLRPVSAATPLPVSVPDPISVDDNGGSLSVDDNGGSLSVDDGGGSITVDGPLTDAQIRATPVPVSGTVTANAGTGPWPVTDNGGSLTVDGPLTDAQLRATPVPVSGTVTVTDGSGPLTVDGTVTAAAQPGVDIGDVTVNNAAGAAAVNIQDGGNSITVDGPLTDAQLRATPVPVSGTFTVGPATSGGLSIYKNLDVNATGALIKGSAGQVYTIVAHNSAGGSAARFLKLYNKATAPVVGTDTPVMTVEIDAKQNNVVIPIDSGFAFGLGIGIGATTGIADGNTGNPGVNDVVVTVGYK